MHAKNGSPVVVGRLRNNDMSDGRTPEQVCRMFFYLIDRMLEREEAQLYGITVFHDMRGLSPKNLHPGVPKLLLRGIIGNFPTRVKGIYILNAPWFFRGLFAVMSSIFFPPKLKRRVHFIEDVSDVYDVIDKDLLLKEHGGNLDFDSKEWVAKQCDREQNDESFETLQSCWKKSK